jgi:hypothetical protein
MKLHEWGTRPPLGSFAVLDSGDVAEAAADFAPIEQDYDQISFRVVKMRTDQIGRGGT